MISLLGYDYNSINGLKILDAGCGTGEKSVILANLGAEVTAVDINENQIKHAKNCASKYNLDIEFIQESILNLDLNKKFDAILCSGVLHHTPNPKLGFSKLCKHLKPKGHMLVGLYNKYSRIHYRVLRALVRPAFSNDPERVMDFVLNSPYAFALRGAPVSTLYDRYAVPYESYHSLCEVRKMFASHGISVDKISPDVAGSDLVTQINWLLKGKSFFFVSGSKL
jgi:SAM-dependent methyltransferase